MMSPIFSFVLENYLFSKSDAIEMRSEHRISLRKHFEILGEMGANYSDASTGVLSETYRF